MSKEITEIINTLCEKLGVAASVLVPELARYNIARLAVAAVLGILITAVIIVLLYKYFRYKKENDEVEEWLIISLIPGIGAFVSGIIT